MRGNQKNKSYEIRWTPEFTYAIGLLVTDGNLSKDGRHFDFTSKDVELVKTFKRCMNLTDVAIRTKSSGFTSKRYPRIQFSNIRLYRGLLKIGLTPNKSKTINKLKIPDEYFFDFVRGCFDGDGTCYSYWDPRWKSSFMFYIKFTSGSSSYLRWLRNRLRNYLNINGHITSTRKTWQLSYAKRESRMLFSKMYYERNLPFLKRKYKKLKNILKIDNRAAGQSLNGRVLKLEDSCV